MHVREKAEKRVDAKIRFQENLFKFIVSNTILAIVCFVFLGDFWLLKFTMLFGGIALLKDLFDAYPISYNRERIVENELSKRGD